MKLVKSLALSFMGLLTAVSMAAPDLATIHGNGIIEVKTASYELSFFPGCMFPFRLKTGGRTLPEPVWLDRIVGMDGKPYFLNIDRFAERKIVASTDREFCVEMSGTYCLDDDVSIPGKVQALYRYKCRPDGIEVDVRISNPEGRQWKEVHVLMPGWKNNPWDRLAADDPSRTVNQQGVLQSGKYVSDASGNTAITLYGDRVTGSTNPGNKYYSYLSAFRCGKWKDTVIEIRNLKIRFTANVK